MKVIIAGSREVSLLRAVEVAVLQAGFPIEEVVSGTARGVDRLGEEWASRRGKDIKKFPAKWESHGKKAGYLRNQEMAEYADALIAIWDGTSKGTKHMIDIAKRKGLLVHVFNYDKWLEENGWRKN